MVFLYKVSVILFLATSHYHIVFGSKHSSNFNINDMNFPFKNNISPSAFFFSQKNSNFKNVAKPLPQKEPITKTQFLPYPQKFPYFKPQVRPFPQKYMNEGMKGIIEKKNSRWGPYPPPSPVKPLQPEDPLIPIPPGMPIPPEAFHFSRPLPPGTRLCFLPPPRNSKYPPRTRVVPCNPEPQECTFTADCSKPGAKCYMLADVGCLCNRGKCLSVGGDPWFVTPGPPECKAYQDCHCRNDPSKCFCRYGKCKAGINYECRENTDCKSFKKCKNIDCECSGNTCEPSEESSTTTSMPIPTSPVILSNSGKRRYYKRRG